LLAPLLLALAQPPRAVVSDGVANLYVRPDETAPVDDQAVLGEDVEILEETAGFARVKTEDGNVAWIPERALRRGVAPRARQVEVTSPWAPLYASADFTRSRPLLDAPLGARLAVEDETATEGHRWWRVRLPDGR